MSSFINACFPIVVLDCAYHGVRRLVSFRLEVEVMLESMIAAFVRASEDDCHVKFTPSFLLNLERWLLEHCAESVCDRIAPWGRDGGASPCLFFSNDGCRL